MSNYNLEIVNIEDLAPHERLEVFCHYKGYTQKDISGICQASRTIISFMFNGRYHTGLNIRLLQNLALKTNLNLNWLLTGKGSMVRRK